MLVKIFSLIDLIGGIILLFSLQSMISSSILLFLGFFLIIKSNFDKGQKFSKGMDVFAGLIFVLSSFLPLPDFIGIIAGILILQKGALRLLKL